MLEASSDNWWISISRSRAATRTSNTVRIAAKHDGIYVQDKTDRVIKFQGFKLPPLYQLRSYK